MKCKVFTNTLSNQLNKVSKATIKSVFGLAISALLLTACSQKQEQSQPLEEMLKDPQKQGKVVTVLVENHNLSKQYINKMLENDHTTGMMVDGLVKAAAEDSVLAGKVSDMIIKFPDLMLMTMHHFMPVINADEHMCDGFCDHAMEHTNLAEGMCHKMQENEEISCCH